MSTTLRAKSRGRRRFPLARNLAVRHLRIMQPAAPLFAVLLLASCTFHVDVDIDPGLDSSGDAGITTSHVDTTTGHDDATTVPLDSGSGVIGTGDGTSTDGLDSSGTTGEPQCDVEIGQCVCDGQVSPPEDCGPCWMIGFEQCACQGDPAPLDWCEPCVTTPEGACFCGPTEAPPSWCAQQYPECTQAYAYRACDPECEQPCGSGLVCHGLPGQTVCTTDCLNSDTCPPTLFPEPWGAPACSEGWCAVPCSDNQTCPNPSVYECADGTCLPKTSLCALDAPIDPYGPSCLCDGSPSDPFDCGCEIIGDDCNCLGAIYPAEVCGWPCVAGGPTGCTCGAYPVDPLYCD